MSQVYKKAIKRSWDVYTDFPYDGASDNDCLNTVASRILYRLFAESNIEVSVNFQGGDNYIAYPWGAVSRSNEANSDLEAYIAPDYAAFDFVS